MILSEVGLHGQLRLKNAKVLVVGVGGLGCPAGAYLAGAGVGTLGLIDGDTVEVSNLHRQIVHSAHKIGMSKVDSAVEYLSSYVARPSHVLQKASVFLTMLSCSQSQPSCQLPAPLPAFEPHGCDINLPAVRSHPRLHRSSDLTVPDLGYVCSDRQAIGLCVSFED